MINQKEFLKWNKNSQTKYVLHIGPTNSGKSHTALQELKTAKNGIYLCPLRLLAWEVSEKLNNDGINCDLITGEEQVIKDNAKFTACTIEMLNYSASYEKVVIDECFMITDKNRGKHWLKAILEVNSEEIHLICNEESENLIKEILEKTNKKYEVKKYQRLTPLICCEKPYLISGDTNKTVFVTFGRKSVFQFKNQFESKKRKATALYGNLPPELKKKQIKRFIDGETDICVSTDVIGMGLNLPCETICFTDINKFDGQKIRLLNSIEIKQIAGRAGRFGLSKEGKVTAIKNKDLNYIRQQLQKFEPLKTAYFGIDDDIFNLFPENTSVRDRLKYFEKNEVIPINLQDLISKEEIKKYLELDHYFELIKSSKDISPEYRWYFITSPVHETSTDYWIYAIKNYIDKKIILTPKFKNIKIANSTDAEQCEKILHDSDLYLYFSNHRVFKNYVFEKEKVLKFKYELIEKLDQFLLDRKLTSIKKCNACKKDLPISHKYNICNKCYFKD